MKQLEGKVALVTGAGRGIGRAIAEVFSQAGARVLVTARTASDIEELVSQIEANGGSARAMAGDITDEEFVKNLFGEVREKFGRLDILINNAGTASFGSAEELPVQKLRDNLELNVVAAFSCLQQALCLMKETAEEGKPAEGKIINIGSVRSHWTEMGDAGAYNASKYALRGLTESVARELHGSGSNIAVGMVCPGVVDTPLANPKGEERAGWLRPETVAKAVLHAVTAPANINVFDTVLFPIEQKPW